MEKTNDKIGMGWLPDYPDFRDFTIEHNQVPSRLKMLGQKDSVKAMLKKVGIAGPLKASLSPTMDLRGDCSPIEDQGSLGSCTAQGGIGLVEYFERRAFGKHINASRLFLYKTTRNLLGWTGDTGAFVRTTMGSMVLFGVQPKQYWRYTDISPDFDREPTAFCYAFAQSFQAITYYRLDSLGITTDKLLERIKIHLAAKLPVMFGFSVFSSYTQAATTGKIPYPTLFEMKLGGHAVDAVGYDDNMKIKNLNFGGKTTIGALLIRNSWGTGWGDNGYGWLPYEYVLKGLAIDWWVLLKNEWIDTGVFGL